MKYRDVTKRLARLEASSMPRVIGYTYGNMVKLCGRAERLPLDEFWRRYPQGTLIRVRYVHENLSRR